jgi:hypothetical protein
MDDDVPVYECKRKGDQFIFFCPKCEKTHYHAPEEGHRVAHCNNDNHHPDGYYLMEKK